MEEAVTYILYFSTQQDAALRMFRDFNTNTR